MRPGPPDPARLARARVLRAVLAERRRMRHHSIQRDVTERLTRRAFPEVYARRERRRSASTARVPA